MAVDPLYWQNSLLLNLDVAGTTLLDISPTPKTGTCSGGAAITAAQPKIGTGSLALDGTGDYVTYSQHADFDMGSGDFCVEMWYRPTTVSGVDQQLIAYIKPTVVGATDVCYGLIHQTTNKLKAFFYTSAGAAVNAEQAAATMLTSVWYHVAMVRTGLTLNLYIDGALAGSGSITTPGNSNTPAGRELYIGKYDTAATRYPNGYIDQVRITKGDARYTTSFTPPSLAWEETPVGTASAALTAPAATLATAFGGTAAMMNPMGVLVTLASGRTSLTAPMGILSASGHSSAGERAFAATAPMGTLVARSGGAAQLSAPMGTLVATITVPVSVHAELTGPMGTLVASGTVGVSVTADLRLSGAGTLQAFSGGQAKLTGPMGTLQAVATAGVLARFAATAPMGDLNALATAGFVVRANLTAPMLERTPSARAALTAPMGTLTASARAMIVVTYEAYAVNLKHKAMQGVEPVDEVTRYTNFPFNQIVRFGDSYFGVADDGLYLLDGAVDEAEPIPWVFKTAMTDDKVEEKKTVRAVRFSGRVGPAATITLYSGESGNEAYNYTTPRDASPQNHREKLGRGIKGRYYAIGVAGDGVLKLDGLEPEVDQMTRKL